MSAPIPGAHLQAVLGEANEFAETLNHDYIGTEHLLVGVLRTDCKARRILEKLLGDNDESVVRYHLTLLVDPGTTNDAKTKYSTPRATRVIELAMRAASEAQCREIDTHHLLLGMARSPRNDESVCMALRVLHLLGIEPIDLLRAVLESPRLSVD